LISLLPFFENRLKWRSERHGGWKMEGIGHMVGASSCPENGMSGQSLVWWWEGVSTSFERVDEGFHDWLRHSHPSCSCYAGTARSQQPPCSSSPRTYLDLVDRMLVSWSWIRYLSLMLCSATNTIQPQMSLILLSSRTSSYRCIWLCPVLSSHHLPVVIETTCRTSFQNLLDSSDFMRID
jgi:hypothetical protein